MAQSNESLKKRFESTADRFEEKGKREWAYAKNGMGGEPVSYTHLTLPTT